MLINLFQLKSLNMKTLFNFLIAVLSATITLAQPSNLGLENWTNDRPDNWWTLDDLFPLPPGITIVSQSTDANTGSYAAKIEVIDLGSGGYPGIMALNNVTEDESENGIPYTLRPDDFSFYTKYDLLNNDSLIVTVTLTKWNGTSTVDVGGGLLVLNGSQATFTKVTVPISYNTTDAPDSLQIMFGVGGILGSVPISTAGSYAIIDDIDILGGGSTTPTVPAAPSNLTATVFKTASTGIRLNWQDNSNDETQFVVQRGSDMNGPFTDIATVAANTITYDDIDVTNGNIYYYRVLAENGNGLSAPSNVANATAVITSVNESIENIIGIYPNPSNGKFKIDLPSDWNTSLVSIFDITGKEIFNGIANAEISLEVAKGTYTLKIQHEKSIIHKRIIIE